jgi:hypothetical protein
MTEADGPMPSRYGDEDDPNGAVPAVYDGPPVPRTLLATVEVDGEVWEVWRRDDEPPGRQSIDYDWVSGPLRPPAGYGFGSSGPVRDLSEADHREQVRWFLGEIDPATGYLPD